MSQPSLRKSLDELDTLLKRSDLDTKERSALERARQQLLAAESQPQHASERTQARSALERIESKHPEVTGVLSRLLDALSEIGV